MVRINTDILRISELKWMGMGEFNSNDLDIYYCGQESYRRNGVVLITNKSLKCSTWVQPQKWQNDLGSFPRQTIQHHSNSNLCLYHLKMVEKLKLTSWSWGPRRPSRTKFIKQYQKPTISNQSLGLMKVLPWVNSQILFFSLLPLHHKPGPHLKNELLVS